MQLRWFMYKASFCKKKLCAKTFCIYNFFANDKIESSFISLYSINSFLRKKYIPFPWLSSFVFKPQLLAGRLLEPTLMQLGIEIYFGIYFHCTHCLKSQILAGWVSYSCNAILRIPNSQAVYLVIHFSVCFEFVALFWVYNSALLALLYLVSVNDLLFIRIRTRRLKPKTRLYAELWKLEVNTVTTKTCLVHYSKPRNAIYAQ